MKLGGKAIFFSRDIQRKYEYLAKDIGCKVIRLQPMGEVFKKGKKKFKKKKTKWVKWYEKVYSKEIIKPLIEEEITALKKTGVAYVLASHYLTLSISARAAQIPLVTLISGTLSPPYFRSGYVTLPEDYENIFTLVLPQFIKNSIAKWSFLNSKLMVKDFNSVAKEYNVKQFKHFTDLFLGDYTFVCDDINLLGLKPTKDFPLDNYVGPIAGELFNKQDKMLDGDIKNHLKRSTRTILFITGSFFNKQLFLRILDTLNQTNYTVIAVYTTVLKKEDLPETNDNILLKQFLPSALKINKMVDLAIIHGGRGTTYTAAYSGKPVIGIPASPEHKYNIDNLVRNGTAIRISKKFFKPEHLLDAIDTIFSNYDKFLSNAKLLVKKLSKDPGEMKAVDRLIEIVSTNVR